MMSSYMISPHKHKQMFGPIFINYLILKILSKFIISAIELCYYEP